VDSARGSALIRCAALATRAQAEHERHAEERERLTVIDDQWGAPTGAELIADVSAHAIAQVLCQPAKAGVYHLPNMDKKVVVAAAKANGHAAFKVDLTKVDNKDEMLDAIAKALKFPKWFGRNFDALADCLSDMDFVTTLQTFEQAANEWREEGVPFWCLVEMQADGIAWLPTEP
jgi:dTDP-4-dehydrorhamnose reductase